MRRPGRRAFPYFRVLFSVLSPYPVAAGPWQPGAVELRENCNNKVTDTRLIFQPDVL